MLARLALTAFVLVASVGHAAPRVAIHVTTATALAPLAPAHARVVRTELGRAAAALPPGYTLDVTLVRLATESPRSPRGELTVHAELRAFVSDDRGEARVTTSARATARGSARERALIERDAIAGAANQLARTIAARATAVASR